MNGDKAIFGLDGFIALKKKKGLMDLCLKENGV
jgi:hypothetical protein